MFEVVNGKAPSSGSLEHLCAGKESERSQVFQVLRFENRQDHHGQQSKASSRLLPGVYDKKERSSAICGCL